MSKYTDADRAVWKILFERQAENLERHACRKHNNCLHQMREVLNAEEVPDFARIEHWFKTRTQWQIEVVPGLIPVEDFFSLLSERKFPSSTWLRSLEQLDYLEEPDMFHDIFGHVPLLADPGYAEMMQSFGEAGVLFAGNSEMTEQLRRLYWFTIEFGLIGESRPAIYGAGIISSFGETNRIAARQCNLHEFDLDTLLNRPFQTDVMQEDYYVIRDFNMISSALDQIASNAAIRASVQR